MPAIVHCEPTKETKSDIRAMARALIAAGYEDHIDIVEKIRSTIEDHTPLLASQIRDIVSGYGQERKATQSELQAKVAAIKAEMRRVAKAEDQERVDAEKNERKQKSLAKQIERVQAALDGRRAAKPAKPSENWNEKTRALANELADLKKQLADAQKPDPEATKNRVRQAQLRKQLEDAKNKLKTGDFERRPPPPRPVYSAETKALQAEVEIAKDQVDQAIRDLQRQNRSTLEKIADRALAFQRAVILSSFGIFEKLSAAAFTRLVTEPAENLLGSGIRLIPGVSQIAAKAPIHGGGLSLAAEGAALKNTFSVETLREMGRTALNKGHLEAQFGKPHPSDYPWLNIFGQLHGAMKAPAKINAFYRTSAILSKFYRDGYIVEGMTPDEADAKLMSPEVQAMIGTQAYAEGQRAILMQDNVLSEAFNNMVRGLESDAKEGKPAKILGKTTAKVARFLLPIVKIPSNIVLETTQYSAGAPIALANFLKTGMKKMSPEQADYIMLLLKKQALGAALTAVGYLFAASFGGQWRRDKKEEEEALEEGRARVSGLVIPKELLHTPAAEVMQMAATVAQVEKEVDKKTGQQKGLGRGVEQGGLGLLAETPFFNQAGRVVRGLADPKSAEKYAGALVAGAVVPPTLRRFAAEHDEGAATRHRQPQTFTDALKVGVPGLREQVPLSPLKDLTFKQRLKEWARMTPEQRGKEEMLKHLNNSVKAMSLHERLVAWDDLSPGMRELLQMKKHIDTQAHYHRVGGKHPMSPDDLKRVREIMAQ